MAKAIVVRIAAVVVALVGAWIVWRSTEWGLAMSDSILLALEGATGQELEVIHTGAVAAMRTIGGIVLGVGLFRALEYPGRE